MWRTKKWRGERGVKGCCHPNRDVDHEYLNIRNRCLLAISDHLQTLGPLLVGTQRYLQDLQEGDFPNIPIYGSGDKRTCIWYVLLYLFRPPRPIGLMER